MAAVGSFQATLSTDAQYPERENNRGTGRCHLSADLMVACGLRAGDLVAVALADCDGGGGAAAAAAAAAGPPHAVALCTAWPASSMGAIGARFGGDSAVAAISVDCATLLTRLGGGAPFCSPADGSLQPLVWPPPPMADPEVPAFAGDGGTTATLAPALRAQLEALPSDGRAALLARLVHAFYGRWAPEKVVGYTRDTAKESAFVAGVVAKYGGGSEGLLHERLFKRYSAGLGSVPRQSEEEQEAAAATAAAAAAAAATAACDRALPPRRWTAAALWLLPSLAPVAMGVTLLPVPAPRTLRGAAAAAAVDAAMREEEEAEEEAKKEKEALIVQGQPMPRPILLRMLQRRPLCAGALVAVRSRPAAATGDAATATAAAATALLPSSFAWYRIVSTAPSTRPFTAAARRGGAQQRCADCVLSADGGYLGDVMAVRVYDRTLLTLLDPEEGEGGNEKVVAAAAAAAAAAADEEEKVASDDGEQLARRRAALRAFYESRDPSKLSNVDALLSDYRLEDIEASLLEKYGELPEGWAAAAAEVSAEVEAAEGAEAGAERGEAEPPLVEAVVAKGGAAAEAGGGSDGGAEVAGLDEQLARLMELLLLPLRLPRACSALGLGNAAGGAGGKSVGVLLCGPSGVGKTALVHALVAAAARSTLPSEASALGMGGGGRGGSGSGAAAISSRLFRLSGGSIASGGGGVLIGSAERALRKLFGGARRWLKDEAAKAARRARASGAALAGGAAAVILLDDIDVICPVRLPGAEAAAAGLGASSHRLVAQLLTLLDGATLGSSGVPRASSGGGFACRLMVVGATQRPNGIDTALRRPGRLDVELAIEPPGARQRLAILRHFTRDLRMLSARTTAGTAPSDLRRLALATAGFTGADLEALCRKAAEAALRRGGGGDNEEAHVAECDFDAGMCIVGPSLLREYGAALVSRPAAHGGTVGKLRKSAGDGGGGGGDDGGGGLLAEDEESKSTSSAPPAEVEDPWSRVGGLEEAKQRLKQAVTWPLSAGPAAGMLRLGISPPRGVLLYGPPGCAKTALARAAAAASHAAFLSLSSADIFDAHVGEAEARVRRAFAAARAALPAILFFDEIEALVGTRDGSAAGSGDGGVGVQQRVLATFLTEMDGVDVADGVAQFADGVAAAATAAAAGGGGGGAAGAAAAAATDGLSQAEAAPRRLLVIGATNRPDMIDKALLRPGRFDQLVYVPPPDAAGRAAAFDIHAGRLPIEGPLRARAAETAGGLGALLCAACDQARVAAPTPPLLLPLAAAAVRGAAATAVAPAPPAPPAAPVTTAAGTAAPPTGGPCATLLPVMDFSQPLQLSFSLGVKAPTAEEPAATSAAAAATAAEAEAEAEAAAKPRKWSPTKGKQHRQRSRQSVKGGGGAPGRRGSPAAPRAPGPARPLRRAVRRGIPGVGGRFGSALEGDARNASDGVMSGADVEAICREAAMLALREQLASAQVAGKGGAWTEAPVKLEHFERAARDMRPSITAATVRFYEDLQLEANMKR